MKILKLTILKLEYIKYFFKTNCNNDEGKK